MQLLKVFFTFYFVAASVVTCVSETSPDVIHKFFHENKYPFGNGYEKGLRALKIKDPNLLRPYLANENILYSVLGAVDRIATEENIDNETINEIKKIALQTTDKKSIQPLALKIVLIKSPLTNSISFAQSIAPHLDSRSLIMLMEWITTEWEKDVFKNIKASKNLVDLTLHSWQRFYESKGYVDLNPILNRIVDSAPYNSPRNLVKVEAIYLKLLANMGNLSSGSHNFLIDYLAEKSKISDSIEPEMMAIIAKGPVQRSKVILWTLKNRHKDEDLSKMILSKTSEKRPELAIFIKQLNEGKIDLWNGVQLPLAELSKLSKEQNLPE